MVACNIRYIAGWVFHMDIRFIYLLRLYTGSWTWMQGACVTHYSRSHKQTTGQKEKVSD